MTSFCNVKTAIDFETAHGKRYSICQVGLVRVENGVITKEISILVQPQAIFIGIGLLIFMELPMKLQGLHQLLIKSGIWLSHLSKINR